MLGKLTSKSVKFIGKICEIAGYIGYPNLLFLIFGCLNLLFLTFGCPNLLFLIFGCPNLLFVTFGCPNLLKGKGDHGLVKWIDVVPKTLIILYDFGLID